MPSLFPCPDAPTWKRFVLGQATGPELQALAQHLQQCSRCLEAVKHLGRDDTLAEAVRAGEGRPGSSPTTAVQQLIDRALAMQATVSDTERTQAVPTDPKTPDHILQAICGCLNPPLLRGEMGRLGPYRLLTVQGIGGMGVVFKAEDLQLRRQVALKVMRPDLVSEAVQRRRFLYEARTAAGLKHEHIVTIHQVGEECGLLFLVMEFMEGESLDHWLKRGRQPNVAQILRLGREIAQGLAAAHERGVIHRDIKPDNLWLELPRGRVKILDFGLARNLAGNESHLTLWGTVVGTPAYMAPEQVNAEMVDHRCDLFSLGCVLYRLCTGQVPFQRPTPVETLQAVTEYTPPSPQKLKAAIPAALSQLVMRLLAKERGQRPPTAHAVIEILQTLEKNLAAQAAPPLAMRAVVPAPPEAILLTPPPLAPVAKPAAQTACAGLTAARAPQRRRETPALRWVGVGVGVLLLVLALLFFFGGWR